jgi:non-ribosomal peptide synthetase component F
MGFNIADLFERAVDAVPDRTAVVCGDASLTFAEFDVEANKMANHLLAEGIGARRPHRHLRPELR